MKIELLEKVMHDRDSYEAGEVRIVDDALGGHFCAMGWARDLDDQVATGVRDTTAVVLTPDDVNVSATVENI